MILVPRMWDAKVRLCLTVLGATLPVLRAEDREARDADLEGAWIVESVEASGRPVEGLKGARLVMSGGKKTFTLPGGAVESGTYTVEPTRTPRRMTSTTEGREGTEKGIYAVEGNTLRICLSSRGAAPVEFVTRKDTDLLLIVLKRSDAPPAAGVEAPGAVGEKPSGPRRFRMGFTGFVHDTTPEAVAESRKFVRENGDIIAHHIEGVPWAEALQGLPLPKAMVEEWDGKRSATPLHGKVYLAISPGRGDLKPAEKCLPIPAELRGKAYDDPMVKKAYLEYCLRGVEFFAPDYLCIGIEVNEIHGAGAEKWAAYAELHRFVYREVKKRRPDLPVFASFTLHNIFKHRGAMLSEFQRLMPENDLVAVSYYPFFVADADRLAALDWMVETFDRFGKPFAMVETNDAAERLPLPQAKVVIEGSEAKQLAYYRKLLALAQERRFAFVISFVHRDYDALWEKIQGGAPELFKAWRDCGLLDEGGRPRPAYRVWKDYFALPLQEPSRF